jgi:hypothetical protein
MRRLSVLLVLHVLTATVQAQHAPSGLLTAIQGYVGKEGRERPPFRHALTDLNADGRADAIVLLFGSDWCGCGGCNMLVFRGVRGRTRLMAGVRPRSDTSEGFRSSLHRELR